jgi:hypothetical protein
MFIGWLMCIQQSLRPHFLLSFHDRKYARRPPNAHSLSRYRQVVEKEIHIGKSLKDEVRKLYQ